MNEEFEQLLEAEWLGDLDSAGSARLEALAAESPELRRRLDQDRRMRTALKKLGPHRAPAGLGDAVFSAIDAGENVHPPGEVVEAIEPDEPVRQRAPWWRWGLAAAVMGVVAFEAVILLNDGPSGEFGGAPSQVAMRSEQASSRADDEATPRLAPEGTAPRPTASPEARMLALADSGRQAAMPAKEEADVAGELETTSLRTESAKEAAESEAAVPARTETIHAESAEPVPVLEPAKTQTLLEAARGMAFVSPQPPEQPTPTPTPSVTSTPTPARPLFEGGEVRLAMTVTLPRAATAAQATRSEGGLSGMGLETSQTGPTRALAGAEGNGRGAQAGRTVGRREIETAIAMAGGHIVSIAPDRGLPGAYRVRTRVSGDELKSFLGQLESLGLKKASPDAMASAPDRQIAVDQPATGSLSRFTRLQGVAVEYHGGEGTATASPTPAPETAARQGAMPPAGSWVPTTGEQVLDALESDRLEQLLAEADAGERQPITLDLLIMQP